MGRPDPAGVPGSGRSITVRPSEWGPRKLILSADPTSSSAACRRDPDCPVARRPRQRFARIATCARVPFGDQALLLECGGTDRGAGGVRRGPAPARGRRARPAPTSSPPRGPCSSTGSTTRRPCSARARRLADRPARRRGGRPGRAAGHLRRTRPRVRGRALRARGRGGGRAAPGGGVRRRLLRVRARLRLPDRPAGGARRCHGWTSRGRRSRPARSGSPAPFTGVYPRSSPGGWQLIARTEERLWDVDRDPPALLAPGTRVRFTDG